MTLQAAKRRHFFLSNKKELIVWNLPEAKKLTHKNPRPAPNNAAEW
jgi:hypothetical protein